MENKKVLTELKDGVLIVTINRNERRNAIDPETSAMMEEVLNNAEKDSEVGCIIITGAGEKSFCAGEDLSAYDENGGCRRIGNCSILRFDCGGRSCQIRSFRGEGRAFGNQRRLNPSAEADSSENCS